MAHPYYFNFKSEELRGAGQPNSCTLRCPDDATAGATGTALAALLHGTLASVTTHLTDPAPNYTAEYPAGTDTIARINMRGVDGTWFNCWLADIIAAPDLPTLAAALIASASLPDTGTAIEGVNITLSQRKAFKGGS